MRALPFHTNLSRPISICGKSTRPILAIWPYIMPYSKDKNFWLKCSVLLVGTTLGYKTEMANDYFHLVD